jgi:hypothetical protein
MILARAAFGVPSVLRIVPLRAHALAPPGRRIEITWSAR